MRNRRRPSRASSGVQPADPAPPARPPRPLPLPGAEQAGRSGRLLDGGDSGHIVGGRPRRYNRAIERAVPEGGWVLVGDQARLGACLRGVQHTSVTPIERGPDSLLSTFRGRAPTAFFGRAGRALVNCSRGRDLRRGVRFAQRQLAGGRLGQSAPGPPAARRGRGRLDDASGERGGLGRRTVLGSRPARTGQNRRRTLADGPATGLGYRLW
jgi:hypothetical protein